MRFLILAIITVLSGCAPNSQPPSAMERAHASREKTLEWLRELPGIFIWPFTNATASDLDRLERERQFNFAGWIEKGRAIDSGESTLIRMLEERDPDVDMERVAFALGEIGSANSVRALIECLNRDDSGVQTQAVIALGKLRDACAVEALATRFAFIAEGNESVQIEIVNALR